MKRIQISPNTYRALIHAPVGVVTAFLCFTLPIIGALLFTAFMFYELNEDMHLKDQAWIDIKGFIWGLAVLGCLLAGLRLGNVI